MRLALPIALLFPILGHTAMLTADQLFLAPSDVPEQVYTPILLNPGSSYNIGGLFDAVNILPLLKANPNTPDGNYTTADLNSIAAANYGQFFADTPTVDYSANLSPSGANLFFGASGSYFVRLTSGPISSFLDFQVGDGWFPIGGAAQNAGPERDWTPPPADANVVSQGEDDAGEAAVTNQAAGLLPGSVRAGSIDDVVNAIKAASQKKGRKIAVNLIGHGAPGAIQFGNEIIGDGWNMGAKEFQKLIDPYVSSIVFISCNTASGAAGDKFLTEIHDSIRVVAGFSFPISVHNTGFDLDAKGLAITLADTPEPSSWVLWTVGALLMLTRRYTKPR